MAGEEFGVQHLMTEKKKKWTGVRPTKVQYLARIKLCCDLLSRGYRKFELKGILKRQYGVSFRTCENYLSRARAMLLNEMGITREEARSQSCDLYKSIIKDPASTPREKILAPQRLDKVLGLEDHSVKVQQTGTITHEHGGLELRITELIKRNPEQRDAVLGLARRLGLESDSGEIITG